MRITTKRLAARTVFSIRQDKPDDGMGGLFHRAFAWAKKNGVRFRDVIGVYRGVPRARVPDEAKGGAEVWCPAKGRPPVGFAKKIVAASRAACAIYRGPVLGIRAFGAQVAAELRKKGYEPDGYRHVFRKMVPGKLGAEDWEIEIQFPIKS